MQHNDLFLTKLACVHKIGVKHTQVKKQALACIVLGHMWNFDLGRKNEYELKKIEMKNQQKGKKNKMNLICFPLLGSHGTSSNITKQ